MKRLHKILLTTSVPVSVMTPLIVLGAQANTNAVKIVFENKIFTSYERAADYYLSQHREFIKKIEVLGKISDSIIDQGFGLLNKDKLPSYNPSNLLTAYKAANGEILSDKNRALASYANMGSTQLQYTYLGSQEIFLSEQEAQEAAEKSLFNEVMYTANIEVPGSTTNPKQRMKMNPTNASDIKNLKEYVFKQMANIEFTNDTRKGWTKTLVDKNGNEIDMSDISKLFTKNNTNQDFVKDVNEYIKSKNEFNLANNDYYTFSGKTLPNDDDKNDNWTESYNMDIKKFNEPFNSSKIQDEHDYNWGAGSTEWFDANHYRLNVGGREPFAQYEFAEQGWGDKVFPTGQASILSKGGILSYDEFKKTNIDIHEKQQGENGYDWKCAEIFNDSILPTNDHDTLKSLLTNLKFDFNASNFNIHQNTYDTTYYAKHHLYPYSLVNVKVKHEVIKDEYLNSNGVKPEFINFMKSKEYKTIYKYNDKTIFQSNVSVNSVDDIKNVSFDKLLSSSDALKEIWDLTQPKDIIDKLIDLQKQNVGFENIGEGSSGWKESDEARELFQSMFRFVSKFVAEPNRYLDDKSFVALTGYDPKEKWISFPEPNVLSKKYNIVSNGNFNPKFINSVNTNNSNSNVGQINLEQLLDPSKTSDIEVEKRRRVPKIAKCWVFYNSLGEAVFQSSSGNLFDSSQFDSVHLTQENIRSIANIDVSHSSYGIIDEKHVFTNNDHGDSILVDMDVNYIYEFNFNGIQKYFMTYNNIKEYTIEYVKQYSIQLN